MTAWRTTPLPADWHRIQPAILERDGYRCTWVDAGLRCTSPATDVDHIGNPDDHNPANLRSLCGWHHRRRTSQQANEARWGTTARLRPTQPHPGLRAAP